MNLELTLLTEPSCNSYLRLCINTPSSSQDPTSHSVTEPHLPIVTARFNNTQGLDSLSNFSIPLLVDSKITFQIKPPKLNSWSQDWPLGQPNLRKLILGIHPSEKDCGTGSVSSHTTASNKWYDGTAAIL